MEKLKVENEPNRDEHTLRELRAVAAELDGGLCVDIVSGIIKDIGHQPKSGRALRFFDINRPELEWSMDIPEVLDQKFIDAIAGIYKRKLSSIENA